MKYMTVLENLLAVDKIILCFRNCSIPIVVVIAVAPRWHQQSCFNYNGSALSVYFVQRFTVILYRAAKT